MTTPMLVLTLNSSGDKTRAMPEPPDKMVDLGSINDAGQVAGSLVAPQLPSFRPFRCTDGLDIVPLPIGIPSATLYFTSGINASGQVVGNTLSAPDRAWLYTGGVSMTRLGILDGFDTSAAFGVNVLGQVVDNMN
jgi:probable HAF family extracellular repeat protein